MSRHHRKAGWSGAPITRLRAKFAEMIAEAEALGDPVTCLRCKQPITSDMAWDIGHKVDVSEDDTHAFNPYNLWPEHRGQCNRAAGAALTNAIRRTRIMRTRRWV